MFLWAWAEPHRLSRAARLAIEDVHNAVFVADASVWEMSIKASCGKLPLPVSLDAFVEIEVLVSGYQPMPIHRTHVMRTFGLPLIHRDPFDRLLVAQALVAGLTLVSHDAAIRSYPVQTLW